MAKPSYRVRPETAILTRGFDPSLSVGAARPPVYRTSTFVFSSPEAAERAFAIALGKLQPTEDEDVDLIYARLSHPNAEILEDQLVPLERGAMSAAVFNSGMAAIATCCFAFLPRGSALLYTQPLVAVDNTFLGPTFQHPLDIGADLAIYSATKFLGGQSDILGGVVLANDEDLVQQLRGLRALFGNILQADEAWILDSRLATVALRMNRQSKNAQRIAERLAEHVRVERLHYPSLFAEPEQRRIRDAQSDYPGSVFSIDVAGGKRGAFEFLRRLSIARNAVSLGGIETLACHPRTTTHSELSDTELADAGITDSLVRISIGTEHWKDLLADFESALA